MTIQKWLNKKFPTLEEKKQVKILSINSLNKLWPFFLYGGNDKGDNSYHSYCKSGKGELTGELDLTEFTNLERLCIRQRGVNKIKFGNHNSLGEIVISGTSIRELDLSSLPNLSWLSISHANQLISLDLSQNKGLISVLVEDCKNLEKIEGLDELEKKNLVSSSVVKGNSKLNSADYEEFCVPENPLLNHGLPEGWKDFFNQHAEEINSNPKKAAWVISCGLNGSEDAKKVWKNGWHDLTSPHISNLGGKPVEDSSEEETDYICDNVLKESEIKEESNKQQEQQLETEKNNFLTTDPNTNQKWEPALTDKEKSIISNANLTTTGAVKETGILLAYLRAIRNDKENGGPGNLTDWDTKEKINQAIEVYHDNHFKNIQPYQSATEDSDKKKAWKANNISLKQALENIYNRYFVLFATEYQNLQIELAQEKEKNKNFEQQIELMEARIRNLRKELGAISPIGEMETKIQQAEIPFKERNK